MVILAKSKKQRQLFETARTIFFQHGVRHVSVEEICRKAKVSKMTFYRYYDGKIDLAKQVVAEMFDEAYEWFADLVAQDLCTEEVIERIIAYKEELAGRISPVLVEDLYAADSPLAQLVNDFKNRALKRFFQFLTDRQRRGDIRPSVHPRFIWAMVEKMQELVNDKELQHIYSNQAELARAMNQFFFYGIMNAPYRGGGVAVDREASR